LTTSTAVLSIFNVGLLNCTCASRNIWISEHFEDISRRSHFTKTSRIAMVIAVIAAVLWATTFSAWADESCLLQGMPASQELQVEAREMVRKSGSLGHEQRSFWE